jgi:DNA-directed RNA polymerase III subunit RPC2
MGLESDQELVQMIGSEPNFVDALSPSLEDCSAHKIFTKTQALDFIGSKIRVYKKPTGVKRTRVHELYFLLPFLVH